MEDDFYKAFNIALIHLWLYGNFGTLLRQIDGTGYAIV